MVVVVVAVVVVVVAVAVVVVVVLVVNHLSCSGFSFLFFPFCSSQNRSS